MPPNEKPAQLHHHLQEHIDLIARHEQEFLAQRTETEKIGDRITAFIGSLTFIVANLGLLSLWIAWNTLPIRVLQHFDPMPFQLLALIFATEAILVASLILMRQSRTGRRSEERDHLMLQILLLTEREITALLSMERQIADGMGMPEIGDSQEVKQMAEQTPIDEMAQIIKESLPTE
jgi:uncharacterized membrane protein